MDEPLAKKKGKTDSKKDNSDFYDSDGESKSNENATSRKDFSIRFRLIVES